MKVIIITGTPGTGKTRLAKALAKAISGKYIGVNAFLKKNKLYESYDKGQQCFVVDVKTFRKALSGLIAAERADGKTEYLILDSHMSHFLPSKLVDYCIVTELELKKLKRVLEKRGYNKAKVRENLDSEIFETCCTEAAEAGHTPIRVNTYEDGLKATIKRLNNIIKQP